MIIYSRNTPFPRCRYCGARMDYWVPGLADDKHSHPKCAGKAMAKNCIKKVFGEK